MDSKFFSDLKNFKVDNQQEAAERRLQEINDKLSLAIERSQGLNQSIEKDHDYDWTKSYSTWSRYEDIDELINTKVKEEENVKSLLKSKERAMMGHMHDHTQERTFFESPESYKFEECERNRNLGNYLYSEGMIYKAAEHYQIAIAYYDYCFPEETDKQQELNELRQACLCNLALCYIRLGSYRKAIHSTTLVLEETYFQHVKALYRRAQAYRYLDEYEEAMEDLIKANLLLPNDPKILKEIELIKILRRNYELNHEKFAKKSLKVHDIQVDMNEKDEYKKDLNQFSILNVQKRLPSNSSDESKELFWFENCSLFQDHMPLEVMIPDEMLMQERVYIDAMTNH